MKHTKWQIVFGLFLLLLSALLYYLEIRIFRDGKDVIHSIFREIAFIPIYVLIVTLMIDKLLNLREKNALLEKMNMVVGAFFSEVGNELLVKLQGYDQYPEKVRSEFKLIKDWTDKDYISAIRNIKNLELSVDPKNSDLEGMKSFLLSKREFLLRLLENPNLLEHGSFTNVLWAVFHFTEELSSRESLLALPDTDYKHLSGDIRRVYAALVGEWVAYMRHLKRDYPYLYSLAVRINPFNPNKSPVVV